MADVFALGVAPEVEPVPAEETNAEGEVEDAFGVTAAAFGVTAADGLAGVVAEAEAEDEDGAAGKRETGA